ncbi:MAG TPA: CAP domain-containing protein [Anaerolineae bacterium]|nr:CAP domain-containing protein [Anaerolineae bacterium]
MTKLYHRLMIAGANFSLLVLLFGCSSGETYIVKPGDTLPQIALNHNIALTDLINANQDRYPSIAVDPENPTPGTELFIPSEGNIGIDEWLMRLTRAASPPITPAPDVPAAPNEKINAVVQLIARGINHERAAQNLSILNFDPRLTDIAQARSNDMIRRGYFSHEDPQRGTIAFQDLIRARQYKFGFAGENIAEIKNQGSLVPSGLTVYARYGASEIADQFVSGWLNSPEHRENIFNPHFTKTGIALGVSVDGTRIVATQIFSD